MVCPSDNVTCGWYQLSQVDGNSNPLHHTLLMLEPEGKSRYYERDNFKITKYPLMLPRIIFHKIMFGAGETVHPVKAACQAGLTT